MTRFTPIRILLLFTLLGLALFNATSAVRASGAVRFTTFVPFVTTFLSPVGTYECAIPEYGVWMGYGSIDLQANGVVQSNGRLGTNTGTWSLDPFTLTLTFTNIPLIQSATYDPPYSIIVTNSTMVCTRSLVAVASDSASSSRAGDESYGKRGR